MKAAIALGLAAMATACGSGGGERAPSTVRAGGCDRRAKESICAEYHGAVTSAWVEKECPAYGATFVPRCPLEGAIARCVRAAGPGTELHEVWYAPATRDTASAMCQPPDGQLRDP